MLRRQLERDLSNKIRNQITRLLEARMKKGRRANRRVLTKFVKTTLIAEFLPVYFLQLILLDKAIMIIQHATWQLH